MGEYAEVALEEHKIVARKQHTTHQYSVVNKKLDKCYRICYNYIWVDVIPL